jgi:hypothetical protein
MRLIDYETLNRIIGVWAIELGDDGTKESDLWSDVCLAFYKGLFNDGGAHTNGPRYLLIDKAKGRVLLPRDPHLWRYLRPLGDRIVLSKEAVHDLARWCNRSPPSWCLDLTKGGSQPSRASQQLAPASEVTIKEAIRAEYHRAQAAREKPPNVKQVPPAVQVILRDKGYWASKRRIEQIAEGEEFKCLRWPPGKRRSKPENK